jgi:hypothetical protein
MTKKELAVTLWSLGVVISVFTMLVQPYRHGTIDWSLDSPFDNTRSGQAEQWIFLSHAARHLPRGASFTILAPDRETEMSLFMMAVGLLPEASPLPSSYYGQSTATGKQARFVLEFGTSASLHPPEKRSIALAGGLLTKRCAIDP